MGVSLLWSRADLLPYTEYHIGVVVVFGDRESEPVTTTQKTSEFDKQNS